MLNYSSPILDRSTWGIHFNSGRYINSPPNRPEWLNPLQKKEWQNRGVVVWDAVYRVVTHRYARYILKILDHMQETDTWKTSFFIVGSSTYQISIPNSRRKKTTRSHWQWAAKRRAGIDKQNRTYSRPIYWTLGISYYRGEVAGIQLGYLAS